MTLRDHGTNSSAHSPARNTNKRRPRFSISASPMLLDPVTPTGAPSMSGERLDISPDGYRTTDTPAGVSLVTTPANRPDRRNDLRSPGGAILYS